MRMRARQAGAPTTPRSATGVPFLTSWYKGFREQNIFKHLYNGVMARGDSVVAISDQIAELVVERYKTPWDRIAVIPGQRRFRALRSRARITGTHRRRAQVRGASQPTPRSSWSSAACFAARAITSWSRRCGGSRRWGSRISCACSSARTRASRATPASSGIWCSPPGTTDVIRMAGPTDDLPAAFAAATVVVNAAIQPEGLQRAILEAEAMAKPVVVSDLGAGPDAVLAPPAVAEDRMTGLRFSAGDSVALAPPWCGCSRMPPRGPGRHRGARACLGAGEFQHRGRGRADASPLRAGRRARAGGLEPLGNCNPFERPPLSGQTRARRATFVSQTANSGRNAVDLGRGLSRSLTDPLRRVKRNSTGEQGHSSSHESSAARPKRRSACQRGDPSPRSPIDRPDRSQPWTHRHPGCLGQSPGSRT